MLDNKRLIVSHLLGNDNYTSLVYVYDAWI